MPKTRKQVAPEVSAPPQVGDKVYPPRSELVHEISNVYLGGNEVDLHVPGTNLERFRIRTDALTYVERKQSAKTSNPFTNAEPVFDGGELLEKIETVQRESLKRSGDDIDILKAHLKTQRAPSPQLKRSKTSLSIITKRGRSLSARSRRHWGSKCVVPTIAVQVRWLQGKRTRMSGTPV